MEMMEMIRHLNRGYGMHLLIFVVLCVFCRRFLAQKELNRIEGDDEQGMKTIKNDLHINSNIWSNLYK